jgi:hypothetical protein
MVVLLQSSPHVDSSLMASTSSSMRVGCLLDTLAFQSQRATTLPDLCDDVLLMICDHLDYLRSETDCPRKCLSLTSRRFHDLLGSELFKTLHINAPIKLLENNQLLHYHAQSLRIDMFGSLWWWCSGIYVSASDALDLFHFIHKLPNLRSLEVSMMSRSVDLFEAAYSQTEDHNLLLLPKIEKLIVTNSATFLAQHCPNLKSLVIRDGGECLVEVYSSLCTRLRPKMPVFRAGNIPGTTLTHLDAIAIWTASELEYLVDNFPNLQQLDMRSETYCYRASVCGITRILGNGLKGLRTLRLSKIGHLDMGFRSVWKRRILECKTEEHRKWLWRENEALRVQAENAVARLAFGAVETLQDCWVGDKRVARRIIVNSEYGEGVGAAKWLWKREEEDIDGCSTGTEWAKYRAEREAVVVTSEVGT